MLCVAGLALSTAAAALASSRVQRTNDVLFVEITTELGLPTPPDTWPDGTHTLPEIMGGGVGLFDYDGDGDLDLLEIRNPPPGQFERPAPNRFYEQLADGTFIDVTSESGLGDPEYGQGVAIGDADNDGDLDVYVANYGPDAFFLNQGDKTFVNATSAAGFRGDYWSTSAAFLDYDRDGDLDLYVVHYIQFDPERRCEINVRSTVDYCGPQVFNGESDTLYRNDGDGTFTDVTSEAGLTRAGKGLGVVPADLTGDGQVDIYVANDGEVNQLWVNNGDATFTDEAVIRGVGFNAYGRPEASMGIAAGDADGDGRLDLFMTHLAGETNTLYMASEYAVFTESSDVSGMAVTDLPYTGFGCGFFDFDNDGDLDVAVVNGGVKRAPVHEGDRAANFWGAYVQPNLVFRNDGGARFSDVSDSAGDFGSRVEVSRGLAFGDIDLDGDIDLVEGTLGGVRVFRNDSPPPGNHWLRVRTLTGNRDALGAEVVVVAGGDRTLRLGTPAFSYASSSDFRIHFGLGEAAAVDAIEVTWPDGSRESFAVPGVDRELTLRQGQGERL